MASEANVAIDMMANKSSPQATLNEYSHNDGYLLHISGKKQIPPLLSVQVAPPDVATLRSSANYLNAGEGSPRPLTVKSMSVSLLVTFNC